MSAENQKLFVHVQAYGSAEAASSQRPPPYSPAVPQQRGPATQATVTPIVYVHRVVSHRQVVDVRPADTYTGAMIYACIVCWFCNLVFGLIAYFLAGEYTIFLP